MPSKMNVSAVRSVFATSVKRWRNHRGLTQEELAERADLHRTYISDVERGARNLSLESIDKLARALEISLPMLFSPDETPGPPVNHSSASASEPVDIILVENDSNHANQILETFSKARVANPVRVISEGAEALDFFLSRGAAADGAKEPLNQIVLLSLDLPKVSGLEVLRQLKMDKRTGNIPIVILAASEKHRDINECKRLGVAAVITRPISFPCLSKVTPALNLAWVLIRSSSVSNILATT
ncbi:MAG TPA: helix-turn-helix domain-containing protein [Verrucomicrobiae bacterium]|nr:helix-turn-helix domain-containing protein [Verrucomicrobiae bacterium]